MKTIEMINAMKKTIFNKWITNLERQLGQQELEYEQNNNNCQVRLATDYCALLP
jgi:hypothetical protein